MEEISSCVISVGLITSDQRVYGTVADAGGMQASTVSLLNVCRTAMLKCHEAFFGVTASRQQQKSVQLPVRQVTSHIVGRKSTANGAEGQNHLICMCRCIRWVLTARPKPNCFALPPLRVALRANPVRCHWRRRPLETGLWLSSSSPMFPFCLGLCFFKTRHFGSDTFPLYPKICT